MSPSKSPEEKAAKQARRTPEQAARRARRAEKVQRLRADIEARLDAWQARRAQERYAASPVGQATAAYERGDLLFQTSMPVDEWSARLLSQIEEIGWHLEHSEYTAVGSSHTTTDADGTVDVYSSEVLTGVYLFRRPESRDADEVDGIIDGRSSAN